MAGEAEKIIIWQWNCASFHRRKAALQQFVKAQKIRPHVLLLQETLCEVATFSGYRVVALRGEHGRGIAAMIRKGISFQEHKIRLSNTDNRTSIEAQLVEIIPSVKIRQNLFILNIYSPPSSQRQCFHALISRAATIAGNRPLLVVGDFNAQHTAWGYNRQTVKGLT